MPWRRSADEFTRILRKHGQEPAAVTDVAAAWSAFHEFLQVEIEGLVPEPDADVDGFIVQWAAIPAMEGDDASHSPVSWRCRTPVAIRSRSIGRWTWRWSSTMQPGWPFWKAATSRTPGFFFRPIGPLRDDAVAEAGRYPQLHAALTTRPAHSELSFDRVS